MSLEILLIMFNDFKHSAELTYKKDIVIMKIYGKNKKNN
jgi:hypothetical protein